MRDRRKEFEAMVAGKGDTPFLTSAWQHFVGHENSAEDLARYTIEFVDKWDWDWVKINPRATYYSEVWGGKYSETDYGDIPIQKQLQAAINSPEELAALPAIDPMDSPVLREHIEGARLIKAHYPDRVVIQTIFSPLSILLQMAGLPLYLANEVYGSETTFTRDDLIFAQSDVALEALQKITDTFAAYIEILTKPAAEGGAGLDGVFYAVTGTASDGYFSKAAFDKYSRPFDLQLCKAVQESGKVVVFHTCREDSHPEWFTDYPISALHWDQFLPGNPPITTDLHITPVGGVNYPLFTPGEDLEEVQRQLDETRSDRSGLPFLLAPSCTIPTPASDEALSLLRKV